MRDDFYPGGTVDALLTSDLVTPITKQVLNARLDRVVNSTPHFFSKEHFQILKAVCNRLIPQPSRDKQVDLAGLLDDELAFGAGDGWRYASMPADQTAILAGLTGIEESATISLGVSFLLVDVTSQDAILDAVQNGTAPGTLWQQLPSSLFFEELLARLVAIYYSHPLGKEEIGDTSFADLKGWNRIGLNEIETYESKTVS